MYYYGILVWQMQSLNTDHFSLSSPTLPILPFPTNLSCSFAYLVCFVTQKENPRPSVWPWFWNQPLEPACWMERRAHNKDCDFSFPRICWSCDPRLPWLLIALVLCGPSTGNCTWFSYSFFVALPHLLVLTDFLTPLLFCSVRLKRGGRGICLEVGLLVFCILGNHESL